MQQMGGSGEYGESITTDPSGNVYITGYTYGSLDGNTSAGAADLFVVKYDSSGVKQWTQQLGTSAGEMGRGIASDSNGNVYVTGYTGGSTVRYGTDGLDGYSNGGLHDLIVVKYNSNGSKQWTRQLGGINYDTGESIASDSSGNVYVTGHTEGSIDNHSRSSGLVDIFIVKYDSDGVKQ